MIIDHLLVFPLNYLELTFNSFQSLKNHFEASSCLPETAGETPEAVSLLRAASKLIPDQPGPLGDHPQLRWRCDTIQRISSTFTF